MTSHRVSVLALLPIAAVSSSELAVAKPHGGGPSAAVSATCQSALPDRPSITLLLEGAGGAEPAARAALAALCPRREALRRCYGKKPAPPPPQTGAVITRYDDPQRAAASPQDASRRVELTAARRGTATVLSVGLGTLWPGEASCVARALAPARLPAEAQHLTAHLVLGPPTEIRLENDLVYVQCSQLETWRALAAMTVSIPATAAKRAAAIGKAACATLPALARCGALGSGQLTVHVGRAGLRPSDDPMYATTLDERGATCTTAALAKLPRLPGAAEYRVGVELGAPAP